MKKAILIALAASSAIATPALAQSTSGTIAVTGSVAAKCSVATPITGTIALNELAKADGTFDTSTPGVASGGLTKTFSVVCTSANPKISVSADHALQFVPTSASTGYTGDVHYTATIEADRAGTGFASVAYLTETPLGIQSVSLGDRLKNAAGNVRVKASAFHTVTATDLLYAGSYTSTITVTIAPV